MVSIWLLAGRTCKPCAVTAVGGTVSRQLALLTVGSPRALSDPTADKAGVSAPALLPGVTDPVHASEYPIDWTESILPCRATGSGLEVVPFWPHIHASIAAADTAATRPVLAAGFTGPKGAIGGGGAAKPFRDPQDEETPRLRLPVSGTGDLGGTNSRWAKGTKICGFEVLRTHGLLPALLCQASAASALCAATCGQNQRFMQVNVDFYFVNAASAQ